MTAVQTPSEAQLQINEHLKEFVMLVSDSDDESAAEDFSALVMMSLGLEVVATSPDGEITARIVLKDNKVLINEMSDNDDDEKSEGDAQSQTNKGSE